ncbi:MAG: YraN family protein [Verrucomicrobiota bacterium]
MLHRLLLLLGLRRPEESLGAKGERLAAEACQARGARVLARNWRNGRDELDLVLLERGVVVFVEVKTRMTQVAGEGLRAVDRRKKAALRRAAAAWIRQAPSVAHHRFDVMEVMVCHEGPVRILHHRGEVLFGRRRP